MAYKDMVLGTLTQTPIDERDNTYFKMAQEVEEVYRKAKILDEVIEVFKDSDLYTDDDVIEVIQEQLDSLERADDER